MNNIETAAADLREAEAALAAYKPREELEAAVSIAKDAVLAAARGGPRPAEAMLAEMESADEIAETKDDKIAEVEAAETFSEDEVETDEGHNGLEASDVDLESFDDPATDEVIFDEDEPGLSDLSATAADVVEAVTEAAEPTETIDATEEVSVEEAQAANPNGQLGKNWPYTAA